MPGIASAATAVALAYVAAGTSTIRVGSGGIMLPNHSPLVIAEQFGTLASLFPGRIDLGLGRAPGTDRLTARALRRDPAQAGDSFPQDVVELRAYFDDPEPGQKIIAVPGRRAEGAAVDPGLKPIWRTARCHSWPALRLCLAFRARCAHAGARNLSRTIYAIRTA